MNSTGPALTVLLAHFALADERMNRRKLFGVLLALAGALMLALRGESGLADVAKAEPIGYLLVVMGVVSISVSSIYARRFARDIDAFDLTSVQIFVATLVVMPLTAGINGLDVSRINGQGIIAVLYGAFVGTFVAFALWFYNVRRFGATAAAMTSYVVPVVAAIGGVLVLSEQITIGMAAGMGAIILGIAVINARSRSAADIEAHSKINFGD